MFELNAAQKQAPEGKTKSLKARPKSVSYQSAAVKKEKGKKGKGDSGAAAPD